MIIDSNRITIVTILQRYCITHIRKKNKEANVSELPGVRVFVIVTIAQKFYDGFLRRGEKGSFFFGARDQWNSVGTTKTGRDMDMIIDVRGLLHPERQDPTLRPTAR